MVPAGVHPEQRQRRGGHSGVGHARLAASAIRNGPAKPPPRRRRLVLRRRPSSRPRSLWNSCCISYQYHVHYECPQNEYPCLCSYSDWYSYSAPYYYEYVGEYWYHCGSCYCYSYFLMCEH